MVKPEREMFQEALMSVVRGLGLHRPDATPCGFPVSLAEACAMVALQRSEPMPQRELAQLLNLDKSTVSRLVADLEGRGWIQRDKASRCCGVRQKARPRVRRLWPRATNDSAGYSTISRPTNGPRLSKQCRY